MKEYMKMDEVFYGCVGFDCDGNMFDNMRFIGCVSVDVCDAVSHAINSHDELVRMNGGLLSALKEVVICAEGAMNQANADGAGWDIEFTLQVANELITKAKGGAV